MAGAAWTASDSITQREEPCPETQRPARSSPLSRKGWEQRLPGAQSPLTTPLALNLITSWVHSLCRPQFQSHWPQGLRDPSQKPLLGQAEMFRPIASCRHSAT